jgi:hypothetical protein
LLFSLGGQMNSRKATLAKKEKKILEKKEILTLLLK